MKWSVKAVIFIAIALAGSIGVFTLTWITGDASSPARQSQVKDFWLPTNATFIRGEFKPDYDARIQSLSLGDFESKDFSKITVFRNQDDSEFTYVGDTPTPDKLESQLYTAKLSFDLGPGSVNRHDIDVANHKIYFETNNSVGQIAPWIVGPTAFPMLLIALVVVYNMYNDIHGRSRKTKRARLYRGPQYVD